MRDGGAGSQGRRVAGAPDVNSSGQPWVLPAVDVHSMIFLAERDRQGHDLTFGEV